MAERNTKVRLSVQVQDYLDGMEKARQATEKVATEAEKLAAQKQAFEKLGRGMAVTGALMAAGVAVAVNKFAEFDEAISAVAATGEDARGSLEGLREAAIDAGASTVFSATESANAIEEMAKAGVSAQDILGGGLTGALDLAAAGGLGVADAAGIAATALQTFNLEGTDMSHVADLLAAGAGKAMGDVNDLSMALQQGGLVAAATGLSIEETTAALASFASVGLLGSDAGTSLKTMLQRLTPQSEEAQAQFDALGISAYDAQGQFVGLADFAGQLQQAMADLTPEQRNAALSVMFGSDAVRAANVLYQEGETGIRDWIAAVDDQGYAAETAATRLDNLRGDWEALTGAVDSALIGMGEAADGPLRFFVQGLTNLTDRFNGMPEGGQQAVFWVGAAGAAAATAGGLYFLAVPKIAAYNVAVATLGGTAQATARALGALGRAAAVGAVIGGAAIGVDALSTAIAEGLLPSAEKIDNQMRNAKSGVDLFAAAMNAEGITNTRQAATLMSNLASELDAVAASDFFNPAATSGTAVTVANQLADIAESGDMAAFSAQFRQLGEDANLTDRQMRTFIRANPELEDALISQASAAGLASDAQTLLEVALGQAETATDHNEAALRALNGAAGATGEGIEDLANIIRGFAGATISALEAEAGFEQALDDAYEATKKNGDTLDLSTQKGRDNQQALIDLAQASKDYAGAIIDQTGDQEAAAAAIEEGRDGLIRMLGQLGITGDEAEEYADKLGLIPEDVDTAVRLTGVEAAQRSVESFIANYSGRAIKLGISAQTIVGNPSLGYPGRAGGGAVYGPGTSTSDEAGLYRMSNNEHVLTAADVDAMGGQPAVYQFRSDLHSGGGGGGGSSSKKEVNLNIINPVTRDLRQEAWEAAQVAGVL